MALNRKHLNVKCQMPYGWGGGGIRKVPQSVTYYLNDFDHILIIIEVSLIVLSSTNEYF